MSLEHPSREFGEAHREAGRALRLWYFQPGARERSMNRSVQISRILSKVRERGEYGGEVGTVRGEGRRRYGLAGPTQRRRRIGAQTVIEPPLEQAAPDGVEFGKTRRIFESAKDRLRRQQVEIDLCRATVFPARHDRRVLTIKKAHATRAIRHTDRLNLDLSLAFERARKRRREADLHLVTMPGDTQRSLPWSRKTDRQPKADRFLRTTRPCPDDGVEPAIARQIMCQAIGGGGAEQFQGTVEVGLARTVGADEHVQARHRVGDRLQ